MLEQHKNTQRDIVFPAEIVNTCLINEKTNPGLKYCAGAGLQQTTQIKNFPKA
jgi:hypothetical protein